jgi:hypothetical protein
MMVDQAGIPMQENLQRFVGQWTMEARFPGAKPTGPVGSSTFEWILQEQFLLQRTESPEPSAPDGWAIFGEIEDGVTYTQHYFDSRGVARLYTMTLDERRWTLLREAADFTPLDFQQRYVGFFAEDDQRIEGRWERSDDGLTWELDFELNYQKVE